MYDAIVIGARCAGSPTAMLLARKGYRVLLVDKATFPSDAPRNHVIHPPGVARLKRWGLLDRIIASNCPLIPRFTIDLGPFALVGSSPPAEGVAAVYGPRRTVLDKILVDAAAASGAELREGFLVQEILRDGRHVTGIRGHSPGGTTVTEGAHIVIGADGMRSLVARTVQALRYHTRPTLTCGYYTYYSGVPIEGAELYLRDRYFIAAFPTNNNLTCVGIQLPIQEFHPFRADIAGNFLQVIDQAPDLAARVHGGQQAERFVGTADLPNFFRKPYGPGWALVGDAGYHKDPYTAQGIMDAFRDAELLAKAIDASFCGRRPLEEALADYERQRNEEVLPRYEFACQLASFEPPSPEMQQLFAALRGNQAETDRFIGTVEGTVSIPEFYSPENIARIVAGSSQAALPPEQIDAAGDESHSLPPAA